MISSSEKHFKLNKRGLSKVSVNILLVLYYMYLGINLETPVFLAKS